MKNKLFLLMGYTGSGKDTLLNYILENYPIERVVSHTTRPIRPGEQEGREYYYITKEQFKEISLKGGFVEYREYDTLVDNIPDTWYYGMSGEEIDSKTAHSHSITIADLEGCLDLMDYYGMENCRLIYISVTPDVAVGRALSRGDSYSEIKRRVDDDAEKFKYAHLYAEKTIGNNGGLEFTISKLKEYIEKEI